MFLPIQTVVMAKDEAEAVDVLLRARIHDLSMTEDDVLSKSVSHQLQYHEEMINLLDELLALFQEQE